MSLIFESNIVDILNEKIFPGRLELENGKIISIEEIEGSFENYILPGFIDSHIHIESSMLVPSNFAKIASVHGTVATISDPHEIANVLGVKGIEFMINDAAKVPFKFYFGAPSCVPATTFETAGGRITGSDIEELFDKYHLKYLSEMMNYPGVIFEDKEVLEKINIAKTRGLPIDGHSPKLRGSDLEKYIKAGISTDHETTELDEALEKISLGMKILIREGSAANDFDKLNSLISSDNDMVMFCSDDKHPDDLLKGHINLMVKKAILNGHNLFKVLKAASCNPVKHYNLDVGLLRVGDDADFIIVNNLNEFNIINTFVKGIKIAENGHSLLPDLEVNLINKIECNEKFPYNFFVKPQEKKVKVIEVIDGEIITKATTADEFVIHSNVVSDISQDILKCAVVNRYENKKPAVGFVKGIGLKTGAIASSVAHDSHNIIAVGVSDNEICKAVNAVINLGGGLVAVDGTDYSLLPLPVAGLMSNRNAYEVAEKYSLLQEKVKSFGSTLKSPFMTLSFLALLVIPSLKLSDKGLFDVQTFSLTELHTE
jgi:adenine deaminase